MDDVLHLSALFQQAQVCHWLIGGHAAELVVGRPLRPHEDIDFFVHADDAARAVGALEAAGFRVIHGSLASGDVFLRRGSVTADLVPIQPGPPPRTLGELAGIIWPTDLLAPVSVGGVPTLGVRAQLAMKFVVADFYGVPLRDKDRLDVAALTALLESAPEP